MKLLKKAIISLPLSLMIALFCFEGNAYTFTTDYQRGIYWKSFPIQMKKFAIESSDGVLLQQLVEESEAEWEDAIGKDIWNIEDVEYSSQYSGNFIRWSYNFAAETGYDASRTLAVTIRYNQGTYFEQVVIILNASIGYLRSNYGGALKKTILHELGHTIGLDHSDQFAIMGSTLSSVSELQSDDIAGMNKLVDEMLYKQQTGFQAFQSGSKSENNKIAACGSVEDINSKGGGSGGQFILSLIFGLMIGVFSKLKYSIRANY